MKMVAGPVGLTIADLRDVHAALKLAPQEARVLTLILQGKRDKQIAAEMKLRIPTVRTYLQRIFKRTSTTDRIELILRAFACVEEARNRAERPQS
jgi:DNA-binding NarL/FixJ family response regulator